MTQQRTTLLLLAAGMGSRYGGVKQIDSVGPNGEALIDYSIYDALRAGFTDLCFVVRAEIEDAVRGFFAGKFPPEIGVSYAVQSLDDLPGDHSTPEDRTKPWGTAHAVFAARDNVHTPFAVVNADDFYGEDSYRAIHRFLTEHPADGAEYAMVGYRLEETLSPHGTVSRGICSINDSGLLERIEEHKKIERIGERIVDRRDGEADVSLSGEEIASMNMFGFMPTVFPFIERDLTTFLEQHGTDPTAEFYIPTLMMGLIARGEASMRVLETTSQWFGMTYQEDKPTVQARIREFIEAGQYPRNLWKR
jgi:hypothetical protein